MTIESGCRMGICGADPVAIKDGMDCLSGISDDEKATLERLGYAPNTRMACCARVQGPVSVALKPDKAAAPSISKVQGFSYDKSVANVVVIGNGIAGVTAVDHIRRRHPVTQIDLIAEEPHHLYNRMGIARLVYGKSAMQGLYLNPDAWYGEREIEVWLNTRALQIDRANRQVHLGTGEKLPYDKLILAMGSRAFVPPIEGFGLAGTRRPAQGRRRDPRAHVRPAPRRPSGPRSPAAACSGWRRPTRCTSSGCKATVLERSDRLLKRQLDARSAELLQRYLEGLGLEIVTSAETKAVFGQGRLDSIELADGRRMDAEILLVAAGIQPNAELAKAAGLATNRGVLVNARMQTGDPHILAAGDVAEFEGQVPGLWPISVAQAEVAADVAVGGTKLYDPVVPVTILKVVGIELTSIGRFEAAGSHEEEIALEDASGRYRKLVVADGRIVGAILLGFSKEVAAVRTAITRGFDVTHQLPLLRAGPLGRPCGHERRNSTRTGGARVGSTGCRASSITPRRSPNLSTDCPASSTIVARKTGRWSSTTRRRCSSGPGVSVEAMSDGAVMRLSYDAFEALSARNPALARHILLDLGRSLAARLRAGARHHAPAPRPRG